MGLLLVDKLMMLVPRIRAYRPEQAHEEPPVSVARQTAAMKAGGVG